jgi:hypothetical protein
MSVGSWVGAACSLAAALVALLVLRRKAAGTAPAQEPAAPSTV